MKTKHLRLMQRVYIVLFFCFMYLPIAYMIVFSFNQSKGYSLFTGFTLKWYSSLLHNSSILHALLVSLEVALISAVIATVLGTAASLGIASMGRGAALSSPTSPISRWSTRRSSPASRSCCCSWPTSALPGCLLAAGYHHGLPDAAHCAYRVQCAVCHLQRHAQAQAIGYQAV